MFLDQIGSGPTKVLGVFGMEKVRTFANNMAAEAFLFSSGRKSCSDLECCCHFLVTLCCRIIRRGVSLHFLKCACADVDNQGLISSAEVNII